MRKTKKTAKRIEKMQNIKTKNDKIRKTKREKHSKHIQTNGQCQKEHVKRQEKQMSKVVGKKTRMIENREKGQTYTESKNNNVQNRNKLTTELKQQMD